MHLLYREGASFVRKLQTTKINQNQTTNINYNLTAMERNPPLLNQPGLLYAHGGLLILFFARLDYI
jgi:hypothetical protein